MIFLYKNHYLFVIYVTKLELGFILLSHLDMKASFSSVGSLSDFKQAAAFPTLFPLLITLHILIFVML